MEKNITDNIDSIIIEHLRAIRSDIADIKEDSREVKLRLTSLESMVAGGRRDNVTQQEDIYRQQSTIDSIKDRLSKIEQRLELSEQG